MGLSACVLLPFFASAENLPITQAQKEYLQHEIVAIVHWGINTYTGQEWGDGEPDNMNSITNTIGETIDPHQWVRAMKAGGIREVIMVSKHHDGFCLWPAENNPDYSTATLTNWPGFHNYNVPSNVCDACKKEGLAFGIYISPWDRHQGSWGLKDDVKKTYQKYFHAQYQYIFNTFDVSEIWFDGAQGDYGYYGGAREKRSLPGGDAKKYYDFAKLRDELNKGHPNAVIFGGDCSNSVVWAGNESGYMDENWNYTRQESGGGYYFGAAEVDTPFGSAWTKGQGEGKYDWHQSWFWHDGYTPKKLHELVDHYFTSVGRGGVLNLGIAPDQRGLVPDNEVERLKEFGDYVKVHNASDLFADATVQTNTTSTSVTLTLTRNGVRKFNVVDFGENLDKGQFVTSWKVEVRESGDWRAVASGGRACWRRMARFGEVLSSDAVRITATGDTTPVLERIHVRYVPTVSSWNEQVDYGDSDAQVWHVRDSEGYHVLPTIGNKMRFNLPDELLRYELEIKLTNVNNAVTFEGYPSFLTLTDEDGNDMSLSVTPGGEKMLFLTGKYVEGTQTGTLVGHIHSNGDAQSIGKWIAGTDTTMTLTLRNEGSRLALYKDGELILKTDKNFGNSGKVKSIAVGTDLATLSGAIAGIRYRAITGIDVEGVLRAAYLWLDASDEATILTNEAGVVTNWLGRSATGRGATAYASTWVTNGPTVGVTSRGKRVVDFGAAGSGCDLEFDRSSGIRTVVMVAQMATNTPNAFFLGDHGEDNYNFHRGEKGEYFHVTHGAHFADGTYYNGAKVADPFHTQVPEGYAVYTLVADAAVKANGICQDRDIEGRNGGKQVAELMIFNGYLGVEERLALEDYLWGKWCAKYTAVVEGEAAFSKIAWTPEKPAGGFTLADILTITNAATKAILTMDENLTAGGLSVLSAAGHDLRLQPSTSTPNSNFNVGAYDFSGANGKVSVGFPVGDAMVVSGRDTSFASSGTGLLYIGEGMQATAPDWTTWSSLVNRGVFAWAIPDAVTWNSVTNIPGALKIVKGVLNITNGGASKESYHFKNDTEITGEGTKVVFDAKEALGWNEGLTDLFTISDGAVVEIYKLQKFGRPLILNGGTIKIASDGCDGQGRGLDLPNGAGITAKVGTTNAIGGMAAGAINDSGRIVIQCDVFPFVVEDSATLDIYAQVGWNDAGVEGFLSKTAAKLGGGRLAFYRAPLQTGAFALNQGTLALSGEGRPTTGTITAALGTTVEVGYAGADQTVANAIAGEGIVRKVGAGTTTLSGDNTYSGGTLVASGTLVAGNAAVFGTGTIRIADGAWLNLGNCRLENEVKGDGVVVVQLTADEEKSETVRLFKLGQKTLAGLSVAVWGSSSTPLTDPKLDVDQDGYCVLVRKNVVEPITATISGNTNWCDIVWRDAEGKQLENVTPDGLKATITVTGNATISVDNYVRMRGVTFEGSGRLTFAGNGLISLGEVTIGCAVGGTYVADSLVYGANAEVDLRKGSPASWTTVTFPDPIRVRVAALPGAGEQITIVTAEGDGAAVAGRRALPNVVLYVGEDEEPTTIADPVMLVWGYAGLYLRDRSKNTSFKPLEDPATKSRNWVWFDADCGLDSTAWENRGLIVGNGRLGAMVMENRDKTRLALNEISLWSGGTCDDVGYSYGPYAGKDKFGSYQPFGDFFAEFDTSSGGTITRAIDLTAGIAQATVVKDDVTYTREVFASRSNQVVVARYKADRYGSLTGKLSLWPDHTAKTEVWLDLTTDAKDAVLSFSGTLANGMAFAATAYVVAEGGTLSPSLLDGETVSVTYTGGGTKDSSMPVRSVESAVRVDGANELTVVIAMETDYAPDWENAWKRKDGTPYELTLKTAKAAAEKVEKEGGGGGDELQAESVAAHRALFDRFEIDLGKTAKAQYSQPTPKRLAAYRQGTPDPELEATHTQFGRYCLIGSAGGVLPANLQGIWNDKVHAPWASDYHNNINLQEAYWAAEVTGLPELHQSLFNWLDAVAPDARLVTQKNFKCATNDQVVVRGWTARISQNPFGGHGWEQWNTSINAWYALHYWEHYQFTQDREFLAKRAYPMMKEACQFWEDYLKELKAGGKNFCSSEWLTSKQQAQVDATPAGTLVAPKGWSHEWGPTEDGIAYDQQLIRNLFRNTFAAAKALGKFTEEGGEDHDWVVGITNKFAHLAPDKIAPGGYLQEWYVDRPDKVSGHRHTSHLFAVYPGAEINTVETPDLAAAAKKSLEMRGQNGDCNRSWTFPWRCALWARLKEPTKAYGMVNGLLTKKSPNGYYNTLDNLLTCHEPFQMDGNFSIPAAVCEMLVQSQVDGTIELLPAVDAGKWPSGSVKGLKARNGITVDFAWRNGRVQSVALKADTPTPVKLVVNGKTFEVTAPFTWNPGTIFYVTDF